MERDTPLRNDEDSTLLLAAVAMMSDGAKDAESNQKAGTPLSPKLRSKAGSVSTSRNCTKKPTTLPNETVEYLKAWMMSPEHIAHPYPTETEKAKIMEDTGLELKQLTNWFVNNRKRYWKPRVEAHLLKDQEGVSEAANSSVQVDKGDTSTQLEQCGIGSLMVEKMSDSPSILQISRRKGQKGKSNFIEDMAKPLLVITPNSYVSSTRANMISGQNSLASQSDGTTSCSDSDDERLILKVPAPIQPSETTVYEKIDVHILRPARASAFPDLTNVTVLPNVARENVLKSYSECSLTYNTTTKKSVKSHHSGLRRESEIIRLKKHCLSLYLAEQESFSNMSTGNETDDSLLSPPCTPKDKIATKRKHEIHVIPNGCKESRSVGIAASIMLSPRPKYRRRSIDVWKEACQTANHVYDDDELPSLEEATRLFGYAK